MVITWWYIISLLRCWTHQDFRCSNNCGETNRNSAHTTCFRRPSQPASRQNPLTRLLGFFIGVAMGAPIPLSQLKAGNPSSRIRQQTLQHVCPCAIFSLQKYPWGCTSHVRSTQLLGDSSWKFANVYFHYRSGPTTLCRSRETYIDEVP